jgi:hypothetical protein
MIDLSLKTQKSVTSTKQRNTILLIVYNIPYSKYQPNLDNYIGTSYNFNVNSMQVQGNYILLAYWHDSNIPESFNFS